MVYHNHILVMYFEKKNYEVLYILDVILEIIFKFKKYKNKLGFCLKKKKKHLKIIAGLI